MWDLRFHEAPKHDTPTAQWILCGNTIGQLQPVTARDTAPALLAVPRTAKSGQAELILEAHADAGVAAAAVHFAAASPM